MNFTKRQKSKKVIGGRIFLKKHRLSPSGIPCFDEKTSEAVQGEAAAGFFSKAGLRRIFCGDKPWVAFPQEKSKLPALSQKANAKRSKNDKPTRAY